VVKKTPVRQAAPTSKRAKRGRPFGPTGPYKLDGAWYWRLAQDVVTTRGRYFAQHHRELSLNGVARFLKRKFLARYADFTDPRLRQILLLRKPVAPRRQDVPGRAWGWAAERAGWVVYEQIPLTDEQVSLFLLHALIGNVDDAHRKFSERWLKPRLSIRPSSRISPVPFNSDGGSTVGFIRPDGSFFKLFHFSFQSPETSNISGAF
jgi:hypothetical protein